MQQTINSLSNQVNKLTDKLTEMQENDRDLLELERLTRAEQRAENLRTQQLDVETKLADLQAKMEQIEWAIKPENIERSSNVWFNSSEEIRYPSLPTGEGEVPRANTDEDFERVVVRLEAAEVASADAEVDLLRRR